MKKQITITILVALVLCMAVSAFAKQFPDVEESHWAFEYINTLSDEGVINGYQDGTFRPSGTITRAEFLKLVMASSMPFYVDMDDAEGTLNHWASNYVWIAETYGVLDSGEYDEENLDEPIPRIEMVKIISLADMIFNENAQKTIRSYGFSDIGDLDIEELQLLGHAKASNLITGYEDGTFKPHKTMTRAEAATMIYRFMKGAV